MNSADINNAYDVNIKPFEEYNLKIYAYTLPEVPKREGYIKVGETSRKVEDRINEQVGTIGLSPNILFKKQAKKITGEWFHDHDLHRFFMINGIKKAEFNNANEWFYFNGTPERAEQLTDKFIACDYSEVGISKDDEKKQVYRLREEQEKAVKMTFDYYLNPVDGNEFLWNAKPRFGKTLTTYDFIRKIKKYKDENGSKKSTNILIVTNRPAIANSWYEDYDKFIAHVEKNLKFISDTDALKNKTMTKDEYNEYAAKLSEEELQKSGFIAFLSLQDLKGAKVFGGDYDKLEWVSKLHWNLLVIDEAHEGVDTQKTETAFNMIKKDFTLHLSGTPFKALADNKFSSSQIYNWSYLDEQVAKKNWDNEKDTNPYQNLPTLNLFTYQMSKMIEDKVREGKKVSEETNVDYAFDLNEFFRTDEKGKFIYEASVNRFLNNLTEKKFPFAENEYREMLNNTFWLLPGVAACKAMENMLKKHDYFKNYEIILAAGDGKSLEDEDIDKSMEENSEDFKANEKSYDKVIKAMKNNEKTITLSCGQLTTGVTIPKWTAVFMLSNIKSPSLYFQAAFRAQNPYEFANEEADKLIRKDNAYIFDFAPERTLTLFDEFANNLVSSNNSTTDERKENIKELLNFFPVIAEDETGNLKKINVEEVLTIPNKIRAREVVNQGFMSNLLFANISAIFKAPGIIKDILEKIKPEKNKRLTKTKEFQIENPMLDENGNIEIPRDIVINKKKDIFGEKIFKKEIELEFEPMNSYQKQANKMSTLILGECEEKLDSFKEEFDLKNKQQVNKVKDDFKNKLNKEIEEKIIETEKIKTNEENKFKENIEKAKTEEEKEIIKRNWEIKQNEIQEEFNEKVMTATEKVVEEVVEDQIYNQEEKKKKSSEDEVRDHLRGFSRTIPAFLMAYGDEDTTLKNFDEKVDEKTFEELTSITLEEFRTLRDGMILIDEETGEEREISGFFDEVVFDSSIKEFLSLKEKLSDYMDEKNKEDIFDYIPSQKTNQIFTPIKMVKLMVDMLEKENENIFKDKNKKFMDPYIKSGLYMTEIIKRLNKGLEDQIPDRKQRIKWIMENQVYGCAPTNILYNMVKKYIYEGFKYVDTKNLLELDLLEYAERGKVKDILKEKYGDKVKFDVIIGNPPYQLQGGSGGNNDSPIYQYFLEGIKDMKPKYISYIIPSRWFTTGRENLLRDFRKYMLNCNKVKKMVAYKNSEDVFENVDIKGGVCYFLLDRDYDGICEFKLIDGNKCIYSKRKLNDFDILIRNPELSDIVKKVINSLENGEMMVDSIISSDTPFGIPSNPKKSKKNPIEVYEFKDKKHDLELFHIENQKRKVEYIDRNIIVKNTQDIDKYKVFITGAAGSGMDPYVLGKPEFANKYSVCSQSYLYVAFDLEIEAKNFIKYLYTKFFRVLVSSIKISQSAPKRCYRFVPIQDFTDKSDIDWSKNIDEIDEQLFDKYNFNEEERKYIKENIKYI